MYGQESSLDTLDGALDGDDHVEDAAAHVHALAVVTPLCPGQIHSTKAEWAVMLRSPWRTNQILGLHLHISKPFAIHVCTP